MRALVRCCGIALAVTAGLAGCATTSSLIVPSPISTDEQQSRILELVPVGTPQTQALEILEKEGIEVHQGAAKTIYYCDLWKRPDGNRWHLDVALLFDRQGRLYRTRSASALVESQDSSTATGEAPRVAPEIAGNPLTGAASPIGSAAFPSDSSQSARPGRGAGARTPFGN